MSDQAFASALAGGLGSVLSLAMTYPLDQLRTVQQSKGGTMAEASSRLLEEHGWRGFYKGLKSGLMAMGMSWTTYYYFFTLLQSRAKAALTAEEYLSEISNLWIATQAGVITCTTMEPFWTINTRQKLTAASHAGTEEAGMLAVGKQIVTEEGVGKLFGGLLPSLLLVSNPAIQFMLVEWIKRSIPALANSPFLMGAFTKFVATVLTYPLQTLKTVLQTKPGATPKKLKGPYDGLSTKLFGTVLTSAFMFLFHSMLLKLTLRLVAGKNRLLGGR